jgi:hypothetical protein
LFVILSSFLRIIFWFDFLKIFIGALVVSRENDQIEIPPNHAMEDVNWVHKGSRWKCKINGCTDAYAAKWLLHQHLDNKHGLRMEVSKSSHPSTCVGPRQQNHHPMNTQILNNPHARQDGMKKRLLIK